MFKTFKIDLASASIGFTTAIIFMFLLASTMQFAKSFDKADTGSYNSANFDAIQDCIDEVDAQYTDADGFIDYSDDVTVQDMIEMEEECKKYN